MLIETKQTHMRRDDYDTFVTPIQGRMVNCVWRIVRDSADTEDVIQEVLLHVMKRFHEVRRHPNPTALLLRMCAHKALDHLRSRKSRHEAMDRLAAVPEGNSSSPVEDIARSEQRLEILDFIRTLPEREAEAMTLHALEEFDYRAVAQAMSCSQSTVRVLIGRARERFREAFRSRQKQFSGTNIPIQKGDSK